VASRPRRLFTFDGLLHLVCKLAHCPDPLCPQHYRTVSPEDEAGIALPRWIIGWDVFAWIGHLVQEGPTLVLTLDAPTLQPQPFPAEQLRPYWDAKIPECQRQALHRRTIMRRARSKKQRPRLLAELERRYQGIS
jgi:hypothetical protein